MMRSVFFISLLSVFTGQIQGGIAAPKRNWYDIQGHRGSRGEAIENTLPSFAWALIDGVTTLELDNGLTKDGVVVVWHDPSIPPEKCRDTAPAFPGDPLFPYVGKNLANLTLSQVKTVDCGSTRLPSYPLQLTYPGTKIATLKEVFDFVACVDKSRHIRWNIESKIDPTAPHLTRGVDDFVKAQHREFVRSGYPLSQITYQSFDWRTLISMKTRDPKVPTAALADASTLSPAVDGTWPWLAGINFDSFPGRTYGVKLANVAKSINADSLSPHAGNIGEMFTTKDMVDQAHALGLDVVPWTVNNMDVAELLLTWGVDGIISDYPLILRRLVQQRGLSTPPKFDEGKVFQCLRRFSK